MSGETLLPMPSQHIGQLCRGALSRRDKPRIVLRVGELQVLDGAIWRFRTDGRRRTPRTLQRLETFLHPVRLLALGGNVGRALECCFSRFHTRQL